MALELSTQDTPTPEQAARIQEVEQWNSSGLPALKATLREHANNGTLTPEREAAIMEIAEQKMGDVTSQLTSITSTSALAKEAARMKVDGLVDDDALRAAGIDQHFGQLAKKNYEQPMPEYLAEGAKNVGLGLAKEALAFTPVAPIARLLTGDPTTLQSNVVVPIVKGLGGAAYDVAASPFSEAARQRLPAEIEAGAHMTADLASQAFTRGMYSDAAKRGDFSPLLFAEMARYEDSQKALAGQGALSKAAGAAGFVDASKPFSPETRKKVEERSVAFDPMNYTPAGAVEAVAGKSALLAAKGLSKVPAGASFVEKAAQLGVRAATGAAKILDTTPKNLAAARGLQTLEQAAKATEAKGIGLFTAAPVAGEKLVQMGKQMKAHALDVSRVAAAPTISGAALTIGATLAGADLGTSLVAGLVATGVGKAAQRRLGTAALGQATEMAGNLLVGTKTSRVALQMLDDYRFAKSALVGAGVGAAAGVPFALLSNDPEEQAAILTAGGALGSAHSVARTGKAFLNGVTLRAAGMGPKGEQAPKNLPLTPYGSSPVADSLHSKADTMLSNAGADFVGSLRETLGDRAEFYAAASPEDANAIAASMGVKLPDGNSQGVYFVRPSDKKPVAISLVGKESGGHETTHALLKAIEADPTTADAYDAAYRAADKALGAEGSKTFDSLKREYETLAGAPVENLVRSTDRGVVRDYLINEVLAEHGSVLLAGLPSGKLGGDPTVTQRVVRGLLKFGENMNLRNVMSGDRSVTTSKALKYNPQFNLLDALSNVVDAVKLEDSKEVAHIVDEAKRTPSTQDDLSAEGILNPIPKSLYEDANYDPTSPTILAETEQGKVPFGSEDNPLSEYDAAKSSGRVIFPKPAEGVVPEAAPVPPAPEVAPTRVVTASDGTVIGTDAAQVGPVRVSRDGKRFAEVEYKAADGTQKKSLVPEENFAGEDASPAAFEGEPVAPGTVPQIRSTPEGRAALAGAGAAPRVSSTTPENVRTLVEQHAQTPYSERKVLRADYDSAVKTSEGDPTRDVRAEQLQRASKLDALGLKNPLREAADKAFIPTTAGKSSKGFYAYNLDKVAANLDRVAIWGTENPEYFKALKTGYDSPTSPEILADHQNYQKNQANGYAGDGRKLAQVSTEGGTAEPLPVTPGYVPVKLPKERAQFLNMLMGTYGKGRSAVKSFPDVFSTRLAEAMGVGVHLAEGETATGGPKLTVEANAMAKKLESLGFDPRDLETAFEQLKYDRFLSQPEVIKGATLAPAYEQVVQAGLMPSEKVNAPRSLTSSDWRAHVSKFASGGFGGATRAAFLELPEQFRVPVKGMSDIKENQRRKAIWTEAAKQYTLPEGRDVRSDATFALANNVVNDFLAAGGVLSGPAFGPKAGPAPQVLSENFTGPITPAKIRNPKSDALGNVGNEPIVRYMPEHSPEGAQYTDSVLSKLRAVTREGSDGDTFNQDGTQYTGGGLVVPLVSQNFDRNAIKIGDIQAFKDANADKMSPAVKVGVYKFPNSEDMSVDLNIVVDPKHEALARRVGADLGQESLFDLGSFENVKTGASGKSTLPLTPEQFKRLGDALSKGEYPQDVITEAYAQHPEIAKAIQAEIAPAKNYPDSVEGQTMRANDAADLALPKEQGTADVAMMPEGPLSSEAMKGKDVQFRRAKPIDGAVGGVLDIVHFSSKELKEIDPSKSFGKGAATSADRQGMNKAFFYTKGTAYEGPIAGRSNVYSTKVDGNSIYDYNADNLGVRSIVNREKRDQAIIDAGFKGYFVKTEGFDAVAIFDKVKVDPVLRQDVMSKVQMKTMGLKPQEKMSSVEQLTSEIVKSPEYARKRAEIAKKVGSSSNGEFFDAMEAWTQKQVEVRSTSVDRANGQAAYMPAEANAAGDGPLGEAAVGLGGAIAGPLSSAEVFKKKPAQKEGTFKTVKIAPAADQGVIREVVPMDDTRYAEIVKETEKSAAFRRRISGLGEKPSKTDAAALKDYNKGYNAALEDSVKRRYKSEGGEMVPVDAPVVILGKSKTTLAKKILDTNPDAMFERLDRANSRVSDDPMRMVDPKGYAELMQTAGIGSDNGVVIPPPSPMLKLMLENGKGYVELVEGKYHGDKTVAGTVGAAMSGLDSTVKMRDAIGGRPPPLVTALHHLWGILSRMLPPVEQEAMWLRLVASPEVRSSIQASLEGKFSASRDQWDQTVKNARLLNFTKRGENATSNANDFYLALTRLNGKWDAMSDAYGLQDSKASGRAFAKLTQENGALGIRNKVQRFIGLTFGTPGLIMDRWKFVEFFHNLYGPTDGYFKYSETGTPSDPNGIYQTYGKMDSANPSFSLAFYEMMEGSLQKAIDNSPEIKTMLGNHPNVGGLHWVGWNAIKNEAVGHSSLDLTYDLVKRSKNPTVDDIAALLAGKEYYVEGAVGNRTERYTLPKQ